MSKANDSEDIGSRIAVIGMAGRFPGAADVSEYWKNLCAGLESVKVFTDEELFAVGETPAALAVPGYVKAWPVLRDMEMFDAGFFGMSPRDAAVMDPQHRFFLEVAWSALEHAGYRPETREASTGVFAACGMNTYMMHHLVTNPEIMSNVGEWLVRHTGNDMNFLATRVSYQMNLKGPSLNVQTACSSSLVAVHLACQSLLSSECDLALAGASTFSLPQNKGYLFKEGEILSRDGHCRPFDAGSRGTLFGSGTGCVVLKRLADAIADRDNVLGVILGSAINNDGADKVGYLAPSLDGQAGAIAQALSVSGASPGSISYVEAHGTGTAVGDPIEVAALMQGYGGGPEARGTCAIGSVKGNIGHLGEAAGMASLIKTLLALIHKKLPPSINYERANPEINFDAGRFFVNATLRDWTLPAGQPRRAGITALGAGGTNAHVVLEEAPAPQPAAPARRHQLLTLSAKTPAALERAADEVAVHLEQTPDVNLADVAFTLQTGRKAFNHRLSVVAADPAAAAAALRALGPKSGHDAPLCVRSVAFMFPGGGAQYAGMGRELYAGEPVYRAALDECLATLEPAHALAVRELLFPREDRYAAAAAELARPSLALPALFATEYGVARLIQAWGIEADAFIGHSMGEYVAACLAGVFSVCDGIALVVVRGKLFETLSAGAMLSVSLPEAELGPLLGDELSIAAVNAPSLCVAAGPTAAIEALERKLARLEVNATRVHISVAAHSRMLEPILPEFERFCRTIRLTAPKVPFISNVTGTWITDAEATDPKYWVRHLRNPVRFSQGVAALGGGGERVLVEVGPGRTLSSLARQQAKPPIAVPSLRHPQEQAHDVSFLLQTLGRVWAEGAPVDFARLHGEGRGRVPLPTYSFDRARYWIEAGTPAAPAPARAKRTLAKSPDLDAWFFGPAWKLSVVPPTVPPRGPWLVFCDGAGIADRLSARVRGTPLIRVTRGETFRKVAEDHFVIRPEAREDYEAVLEELERRTLFPAEIIYLWPLDLGRGRRLDAIFGKGRRRAGGDYDEAERLCFTALLSLAQAVGPTERPVRLSIVSTGLHGWKTERPAEPDKALLLGPMRVIPREFPNVSTRSVDLRFSDAAELELAASRLFDELAAPSRDAVVALRGLQRWTQTFEPMPLGPARRDHSPVRQGGTYVISGGLGGIGLELGLHLAKTAKAKLVLVGRAGLPDRATWPELRAAGGLVAERLEKIGAIEAAGGEVLALAGDVTSRLDMERVAAAARRRFGRVHGVIHAAGMLDDGLISLKTHEAALRVIAAKARGALVLDEIFGRESLDLFVVFSSVSSVLGLEGQIDYTAANAFLDAFAEAKAQDGAALSVSIGWNAWQEVGMAMAFAGRSTGAPARNAGPWIERVAAESAAETLLVTSFSRGKQWMLGEHVVRGGEALIPGTGYLELARAAFARKARPGTIEIRDLTFFAPFVVKLNETRDLHVRLSTLNPRGADVTFYSHAANEPHAAGRVELVDRPAPPRVDIAALLRRCSAKEKIVGGFMDQAFMEFGPRWKNVERVCFGVDEAVISLSLPESLASDLADFPLHPGLLDMATGGAQLLIEGFDCNEDFYVPFSYARVTAYDALAPRLHSHVRHRRSDGKDFAVFDATIYDDEGRLLVDISGFTMRRVPRTFTVGASDARAPVATDAGAHGGRDFGASKLGAALKLGMSSAEGMEAFDRIMAARASGHVIASSVDLREWLAFVDEQARPAASPSDGDAIAEGTSSHAFARPSIATEFVSPTNDLERALAGMWCEVLGLREIGIHDDFFELGGQSLVALRLFSKIRKKYGVDLPLSTLFEAPTIKQCAEVVAAEAGVSLLEESASDRLGVNGHIDRASVGEARPASEVPEIGRWFSRAVWREDIVGATADPERRTWLVFVDQAGVLNAIAERLRAKGHRVITVREGDTYHKRGADDYQVFPEGGSEGYERLLRDVWAGGVAPTRILHGWLVTDRETFRRGSNFLHRNLELGFTSLLLLAQGLAKQARSNSIHLITIATGMQRVGREKGRYPEKAAALGPALVMPKELSGITTSVVDIALPTGERTGWLRKAPGAASVAPVEVLETLEAEVLAAPRAEIVALRGRSRFVLGAEAVALEASLRAGFKDRGVYLITNGFAGSGPSIAWHLAKRWRARLVLLDPSSRRGAQASDNVTSEVTSERARRVRALEELGAEVLVAAAQVMNVDRLREVVREAEERFGVVDGVIHTGGARRQGSLVDEQDAGVESVFAPRIYGTLALAEVFRAHRLDFLLLCSTATVLDAAAGQTGEVAASAFLDAFADTVRDSAIIALDWQPSSRTDISSDPLASGVTADDELTALERVLSSSPHASLVMSATALASVGRAIQTGAAGPRSAEAARPPRLANAAAALIDGRPEAAAAARLLHLVKMCAPAGTRQSPLFVVAGLLGNVLNLRRLAQIVGAERPVYGLQARGLFGGLKPHETFEEMARDYLTELRTVQSRGPFLLSGFSGGGITAYEMARQLIEEGETVQLIAFLDTPVLRRETLTLSDRLSIQAQNLRREGLAHVGRWMEGKRAYRRSVQTRGERLRAQHAGETHDFHSQVIEAAFYRALSRYAIRPLAVRATVFRPKLAPVYRLSGGRLLNRDRDHLYPDNGWGPFIEKLDIREVPGDHDSMVLEPNVRVLAAQVIEAIERAVVPAIAVAREAGDGVGR